MAKCSTAVSKPEYWAGMPRVPMSAIVKRRIPPNVAEKLIKEGMHPVLARLYAARGVSARSEIDEALGHRGVRLAITYPEIYAMQIQAILEAAALCAKEGTEIYPEIMVPQVRLNGIDNEPLGIVSLSEALRMAGELDVDLVEIAATASPPVCRLMDYGKFKYQEQKKAAEAKSKQKVIEVKEIKFRPGTDDGDYNIKMRNIRRFLDEGDKCKITLRFRGREITHQEIGMALLQRIRDELADSIVVEQFPKLEGRQMIMMIAPGKKKSGGAAKPGAQAAATSVAQA